MKRIRVNLAFLAIDTFAPLLLCCKETEENQRKRKYYRKEKKGRLLRGLVKACPQGF